jgi:hypothetical protein
MRRAAAAIVLALAGLAHSQSRPSPTDTRADASVVFVAAPLDLAEKVSWTIDPAPLPRLAIVRGRRRPSGDAVIEVGGSTWGTAAGFDAGAGLFDAALPIAGGPGGKKLALAIRPTAPGVTLDRVEIVPAARVRFVIRDQATKAVIPGSVTTERLEGGTPPVTGPFGGFPRERTSWISGDGHGDVYGPPMATLTFAGRASPFRGVARQRHALEQRDSLLVTLLLPADQLPEDATILEGPPRPGIAPEVQRAADRARGIGKRPKGFRIVPAAELLAGGIKAVEQVIAHPDEKFLATNETGPLLCPAPLVVTAELAGGELLHSNGPVILLVDRRRESGAVRAFVKVRLPEGVVADRLFILAGGKRTEHPLNGPSTIPLDVIVPPGTPIGLVVSGPAPQAGSPDPAAAAFRVFKAP